MVSRCVGLLIYDGCDKNQINIIMKKFILILFVGLLLGACGDKNTQTNWEYIVISIKGSKIPTPCFGKDIEKYEKASDYHTLIYPDQGDIAQSLNIWGRNGWELVSTYTTVETVYPNFGDEKYHTGIKENTRTEKINFVFKRPVLKKSDTPTSNYSILDEEAAVVEEAVVAE